MVKTELQQMVLPISEVAAAYKRLWQQCQRFVNAGERDFDAQEAHKVWAKLLRFHSLLELARATEHIAEAEPSPSRLRRWSWQCGAEAI
jgi:hypothetical protein